MELAASPEDESNARSVLERAGVRDDAHDRPMVMLNPGANKEWKRWPAPRFAALAKHLHEKHNARVLLSGAPNEADLIDSIAKEAAALTGAGRPASAVISLPRLGMTMGGLKAMMKRCRLLVTNDTGPRHIAAALGVPLVSLFGPTDHRWAPIPTRPGASEIKILADPTLPETESANDQPERCAIDEIEVERVCKAVDQFLAPSRPA
jgi:ADP-heptose:LPS heptosyltransferase